MCIYRPCPVFTILSSIAANIALGRQTWAYPTYPHCQAAWAVDGNRNPNYNAYSCWSSDLSTYPWWAVSLGRVVRVYGVNVTSREDDGNGYGSK
jgi:hypothetical protein